MAEIRYFTLKLIDQPLRDCCTLAIELVRAVRGFAEQHEAGIANEIEELIVIRYRTCNRPCHYADSMAQGNTNE